MRVVDKQNCRSLVVCHKPPPFVSRDHFPRHALQGAVSVLVSGLNPCLGTASPSKSFVLHSSYTPDIIGGEADLEVSWATPGGR